MKKSPVNLYKFTTEFGVNYVDIIVLIFFQSNFEQTVAHGMAQVITTKYQHIAEYTEILKFLTNEGLDLNAQDRYKNIISVFF